MSIIKEMQNGDITFKCPGCGQPHFINYKRDKGPKWDFNGDFNRPTISPSIRVRWDYVDKEHICHSFVRDGKIQFLDDCTHDLKGQTVQLDHWME